MNKCEGCTRNCCGNKFIGLRDSFKHDSPDIFCQILLSNDEADRIIKQGGAQYVKQKDGVYYIELNDDFSCKAFKDGRCGIYEVRPNVCRLYPFFFDPFAGILIDKNCEKYSHEEFDKLDASHKQEIFNLLKARIKFFEDLSINKK